MGGRHLELCPERHHQEQLGGRETFAAEDDQSPALIMARSCMDASHAAMHAEADQMMAIACMAGR